MLSGIEALTGQKTEENTVEFVAPEERASLDRDDFMNLFVTQLQYQDPMNPMDTADMSSQLAQFNMVDLMYKNTEAMEKLVASDESRTRLQALAYLGHEVRYEGDEIQVTDEGPLPFDVENEEAVASCVVTIRDKGGALVKSWDLGALPPGKHSLEWDGTDASGDQVDPGTYQVKVQALDETGEEVSITTWSSGIISKVTYPDKGLPLLTIENGPDIALDEIWMVGP